MDETANTNEKAGRYFNAAVTVFWSIVGVFLFLVVIIDPFDLELGLPRSFTQTGMFAAFAALFVLSGVLIFLVRRAQVKGWLRLFMLLTGSSMVVAPLGFVLHNLVYGLMILWFGEGFWERFGGDEAFFFILTVLVCPAVFIIGVIGSITVLATGRHRPSGNNNAEVTG